MGPSASLPAITVVTVVRNGVRYIEDTLKSVLEQSYAHLQYVVVDGASTDGTVEIIERHADWIDTFISEPDNGIGSAMNKALALARGDFVLFLHADDYLLHTGALAEVAPVIGGTVDIFACPIYLEDGDGTRVFRSIPGFGRNMLLKTGLWHQGVLCRRTLFDRIGSFDETLTIAMDYDFFLRAYLDKATVQLHDRPISVMRTTGISSRTDPGSVAVRLSEERKVHFGHARSPFSRLAYQTYWCLYPLYRRLRTVAGR